MIAGIVLLIIGLLLVAISLGAIAGYERDTQMPHRE